MSLAPEILPACENCRRPMFRKTEERQPGLVAHGGNGLCDWCAQSKKRGGKKYLFKRGDTNWLISGPRPVCRRPGANPDWWHPHPADRYARARAVELCRGCPVLEQCREDALTHAGRDGVVAGMTGEERSKLRTLRSREAA